MDGRTDYWGMIVVEVDGDGDEIGRRMRMDVASWLA